MKTVLSILVLLFSMTTLHTNAENPFARASTTVNLLDEPKYHSFLKPEYNQGTFNTDTKRFCTVMKEALKGDMTYFQDPLFGTRFPAHLKTVLGDQYPGSPEKVIDGLVWIDAPANFMQIADVAMLQKDGPSIWESRNAYPGEKIGLDPTTRQPVISSHCGNLVRAKAIPPAPPAPPKQITTSHDTTIMTQTPGTLHITISNNNTNNVTGTNTNTIPAGTMGASNVSFANPNQGNGGGGCNHDNSRTGGCNHGSNDKRLIVQNKPHWSEVVRNVGTGLGFAAVGVASIKNAFDPEPLTVNVNGFTQNTGWNNGWNGPGWTPSGNGFQNNTGVYTNNSGFYTNNVGTNATGWSNASPATGWNASGSTGVSSNGFTW